MSITLPRLLSILRKVSYCDYRFRAESKGDGFLVQVVYFEPDADAPDGPAVEQHGRKWYISSHACESEIVRTLLAACLASAEHRVREHFFFEGQRIFSPHYDVHVLVGVASHPSAYERRPEAGSGAEVGSGAEAGGGAGVGIDAEFEAALAAVEPAPA